MKSSRFLTHGLRLAATGGVCFFLQASGGAQSVMVQSITAFRADDSAVAAAYDVPWAEGSFDRRDALLQQWLRRIEALNYEELPPTERIDWHLLRTHLGSERAALSLDRQRLLEMDPLLAFRRPLQALLAARTSREGVAPEPAAGVLAATLIEVKGLRKKLEQGRAKDAPVEALKPGAVHARRAADAIDRLRGALGEWFAFYHGFQPDFSWWVRQPHEALAKAMEETAGYLRKEIAGLKGEPEDPLVGDPIGAEALVSQLTGEMIPYSAAELLAMADREFAWCEAEMKSAAAAMGYPDARTALAKIKTQHVAPGGQPEVAQAEALKAIRFIEEKDLVTVPPLAAETWRLAMLGVEQQKSLPYAVYGAPRMMVAYAHESMPHEDKLMSMRGNNAAFLHIVTPHELIPGHHLQGFMAQRHASHRRLFSTPFLVEGWALHWEMLLWDLGYTATPEEKVGALFWRMHRCARIIVSLKFHLGEMTPPAMIDFLVERVGHEKSGATAEVRRYISGGYGPLYQAAYMLGGLQLRALYRDLTGPGGLTPRAFHDAVLHQGAIPIEMIRAALTNQSLPRNWQPGWRF